MLMNLLRWAVSMSWIPRKISSKLAGEVYDIELIVTDGSLNSMEQDVVQDNSRVAT